MRPYVSISIFAMAVAWASLAQADPRAMMMGAAWVQQRQARQSVGIQKPSGTLFRKPAPTAKAVKPPAAAKNAKPAKAPTTTTAPAKQAAPPTTVKVPKKNAKPQSTPDVTALLQGAPAPVAADPPAAVPASVGTGVPPETEHPGILARLMRRLGRMVGAGLRKKDAAVAKVKQAAASLTGSSRPGLEPHRIPYGSLPVGVLLSRLRLGTLHQLNPNTLVQLRQARVITEVEYQVLLQQMR